MHILFGTTLLEWLIKIENYELSSGARVQWVADVSPWRLGLSLMAVHVGFMLEKLAMR
jgi:hypothetical protein